MNLVLESKDAMSDETDYELYIEAAITDVPAEKQAITKAVPKIP
ncbi:hypothetical protein SAMN05192552_102433 [Natrinema hispanicum]|uniref:Uncharacterized protein n=1 Tax=Natrinema hispanicum TaxID=392421 RepID=A0A1G6V174_9EURY|nr:hypothetical protein SAMN05192552_102433 [Natrinema hispanicum]